MTNQNGFQQFQMESSIPDGFQQFKMDFNNLKWIPTNKNERSIPIIQNGFQEIKKNSTDTKLQELI